MVHKHGWVMC